MSKRKPMLHLTVEITPSMVEAARRRARRYQDPVYLEIKRLMPRTIRTTARRDSVALRYVNPLTQETESDVMETHFPKVVQAYRDEFFRQQRSWMSPNLSADIVVFKLRLAMPRRKKIHA